MTANVLRRCNFALFLIDAMDGLKVVRPSGRRRVLFKMKRDILLGMNLWDPGCQREYESRAAVNTVVLHLNQTELISSDQNGNIHVRELTTNSCSCELMPQCSFDQIGLSVIDMVMWNDVAKSALWIGCDSFCFRSSYFTTGEPSMTLIMAPLLLLGYEYGHIVTFKRLCALGFFIGFTWPKLYSLYSIQICKKGEYVKVWILEAWGAFICVDSCSNTAGVFKMVLGMLVLGLQTMFLLHERFHDHRCIQ